MPGIALRYGSLGELFALLIRVYMGWCALMVMLRQGPCSHETKEAGK